MDQVQDLAAANSGLLLRRGLALLFRYGVYVIFVLVVVFFANGNPRFLTVNNFLLILQQASPLGIAAVGMTYVLILAGIDISVGRNMFLSAHVVAYLINQTNLLPAPMFGGPTGYLLAFGICMLIGCLTGLVNAALIAKLRIVPFIATLATGSIIRGIGLIISNSRTPTTSVMSGFVNSRVHGIPVTLIFFIVIAVCFDYVLRYTVFGKHLMAIGNSPEMARKTSIRVDRNVILAYVLCGTLAGLAGALLAGQIGGVSVSFGEGNEFIVISAAVLGGTSLFGGKGSIIPGAIVGILLVTTIMNGLAMINASPYVYTIVRGAIIFVAVMVDSVGFKGELR
jgi:ribose/xylose/arabinose/galactoside ABC-type transport system permease subunit